MAGRYSSEIRTGCANQRPSGSVRGAASNGCPYRDRQLPHQRNFCQKTATRKIQGRAIKNLRRVYGSYWIHPILKVHRTRHNCLAKGRSCFSSELRTQLDSELTSRAPPSSRPQICASRVTFPAVGRQRRFQWVQATQIGLTATSLVTALALVLTLNVTQLVAAQDDQ
jgi:hypothetical protein